jgi:ankyrin repeat protein
MHNRRTPLIIACERGNLNIVQMLIERGLPRRFRSDAFFIAFERGDEAMMNYLVTRCDLRKSEDHDRTALDCIIS